MATSKFLLSYRIGLRVFAVLLVACAAAPPSLASDAGSTATVKKVSPFRTASQTTRATEYYRTVWGVDHLAVEQTASGSLIRFKYRVVDPALAKPLGAKETAPTLYNPRTHASLQIPVMDKVGQLRQAGTTKAGDEYWMAFSNKGKLVKPGDRVSVSIGAFHADGLLVL
jgi:hypothetical protein